MVATLLHNRIAGEIPSWAKSPLPDCERKRGRLWNDAVLEAVLALRNQLGSRNEEIVAAAANSILELERTRMRHDKSVSGTRDDRTRYEPPPVAAVPERPAFTAEEEPMVAEHAREVRAAAKEPMSEAEAVAFVVEKLEQWQVRPGRIYPGEFAKMLGMMGEAPLTHGPAGR